MSEWDKLPELRKKKWLEIALRYQSMKPDEQMRLQERMRDWVKLTPEQRMAARENFTKANRVKAEKKSAQWQQYQQLSEEEKKRLAAENKKKKSLTNLPPDALKNTKILAPIKVGPKHHQPLKPAVVPVAPPPVAAPQPASAVAPASLPETQEPITAPASVTASQTVTN
ncbi:MAG: DUF3106 domain-containing protein [Burkholderiales bacterium]|nr:DUF3106 domain-containing protein [Burkholderiales bacterium]